MVAFDPAGLLGFTLVAPSIWEYVPADLYRLTLRSSTIEAPLLVLLCTWTGAQCRHITKYTDEYQRRFPSTRIMVVTTSVKDLCLRSSQREQQRLWPAVDRIVRYQRFRLGTSTSAMLMHVFSDGGSHKACELAKAYYAATNQRLPVAALCLDSTPGCPRYRRLCRAASKALPPIPLLRHTSLLVSSVICACIWAFYRVVRGFDNNVMAKTRRQILDPTYWDLAAPRCYLYSDSDAVVFWRDIEDHIGESLGMGIPVVHVRFQESEHVRHASHNWTPYWDAVATTWGKAVSDRGGGFVRAAAEPVQYTILDQIYSRGGNVIQ